MIHRMYCVAFVALMAWPAGAQNRGVLAIDEETARYAFSFGSEADALNMCGTAGCEVVAEFSACLAVAYSSVMIQQEQSVWTWVEADTEGAARREALDECERAGGAACAVLNAYCAADPATSPAASAAAQQAPTATPEQETVFWQSIMNSTNPADFEAYLAQFPNGVFRALAEVRLAELRAPSGDVPAAHSPRGGGVGSPAAAPGRVASTPADAPQRAGETRVFDGMEFVWVPAGEFRMGSTSSEAEDDEQPVTRVRISRGFSLGKHEVTQAEWQGAMGTNPSAFFSCGQCPVNRVSWNDAQEFVGRLNGRSGGNRYRLPTEAEWEYAARAGTTRDRYGNLDAIGWCRGNSADPMPPVGGKAANAWGLHDMLGNVSEWVEDWYGAYPGGAVTDPRGPASGSSRVLRGGSWFNFASGCRASNRIGGTNGDRDIDLGFRLLRTE